MSHVNCIDIIEPSQEFFKDKWFISDSFEPALIFNTDYSEPNHNYRSALVIYKAGNCFNTREEALEKCNLIRSLLNSKILND